MSFIYAFIAIFSELCDFVYFGNLKIMSLNLKITFQLIDYFHSQKKGWCHWERTPL